jgi:hypothetical protein
LRVIICFSRAESRLATERLLNFLQGPQSVTSLEENTCLSGTRHQKTQRQEDLKRCYVMIFEGLQGLRGSKIESMLSQGGGRCSRAFILTRVPGFCELRAEKNTAFSVPRLISKCIRPRGKMVTSPGMRMSPWKTPGRKANEQLMH